MPLLYPLAMAYFIANYWVDKGAILRIYRMDGLDGLDGSLALQAITVLPWAVIVHCAATVMMYSDAGVTCVGIVIHAPPPPPPDPPPPPPRPTSVVALIIFFFIPFVC